MEFTITREELLQGLYLTQGIVERRTTIPILANVLIDSSGDGISIAATDQEVGVRRRCEAKVKKKGSLTTSARKLYEISRELPEAPLTIRSLDNNWIEVSSGKSRFKIVGLDPKEFPAMPSAGAGGGKGITIPSGLLKEMIERASFAVSTDETRLNLSGIYFERPEAGKLRLVATDGHRLSMITRAVEGGSAAAGVIIPRKGVGEIAKILETGDEAVTVDIQGGVAHLTRGPVELSMRLVEGEFPDYKQVVPQKSERRMVVGVEALLGALRRVSIVSSERTRGVKMQIEPGRLELSSINPDLGEASEDLSVEYEGAAFGIGFNAKYLIDVLGVLGPAGQVEIGFNDEVSPGVLRSEGEADFLYVVMPMRL
ncbi:MAG TPA: DNA polymerase III subunit beta [Candidatus Acidoferrales bacterium]|nr:DNA polymerase III subunit beta [Candidatus Acidoferrales bacterium]